MQNSLFLILVTIFFSFDQIIFGQEKVIQKITIKSPQTTGDDFQIKDDEDNTIFKVIDEGSFGSIEF